MARLHTQDGGRQTGRVVSRPRIETREDRIAALVLRSIHANFATVSVFTREDMLFLPTLSHVSTITRYNIVCDCVRRLLADKRLTRLSRTDLCLPEKRHEDQRDESLHIQYAATIRKLVNSRPLMTPFSIMDVVTAWEAARVDQHLTTNRKRTAVRNALRAFASQQKDAVEKVNEFDYRLIREIKS